MTNDWNRRRFLQRAAIGCAGISAVTGAALMAKDAGRDAPESTEKVSQIRDFQASGKSKSGFIVVAKGTPDVATKKAIETLGGMKQFIEPGDTVVIKPNVGWDRTPVQAANTNPLVIRALVEMCVAAKAKKIIVTDNTCNEPSRCFTRSGIWKMAEEAGAEVVLPAEHRFRNFDIGGVILGQMPVLSPAVTADKFINVPIAKHHGLSKFTGAMKNLYGVLGGRRNRLHQNIDHSIADLADFIRPTLTVMDATRVLLRNGPQGGNIQDTKEVGEIIASTDQVAVDTYSCGLIGLSPADLPYLRLAASRGLGVADLKKIRIKRVS
ncbi:MAG: DUF362 domain-containing protein [Deltaproteobacteria bacterium]|nr:DUF362 domain-containing protein [Deltaproteobacteria bacterium]MBN2670067.1 DUF362 domain-containing protein [Deltaproteobacteria bacterium]